MKLRYYGGQLVGTAETLADMKLLVMAAEVKDSGYVSSKISIPLDRKGSVPKKTKMVKNGIKYHANGRPTGWPTCDVCGHKERSYPALNKHYLSEHNMETNFIAPSRVPSVKNKKTKEALECPECGKVFYGRHALANHLRKARGLGKVALRKRGIFLDKNFGDKVYHGMPTSVTTNYLETASEEDIKNAIAKDKKGWLEV